jgi:hypothetical protein
MSYAPQTKLSCDSSTCTVLTDNHVFVTWGLGINQRMPLADWRIIIGSETVREDYLPLEAAVAAQPQQEQEQEPEQEPQEPDPIGTKWHWRADNHNYCVAILTKHGVLQVKKSSWEEGVNPYVVNVSRQMFPTYEAWFATLPAGGAVTKTLPQDMLSELQRRRLQCAKLLADEGGTVEAIRGIQSWWKVRTLIQRNLSINQRITFAERQIANVRGQLQKLTLEDDLQRACLRRRLTRLLQKNVFHFTALKASAAANPRTADYQRTYFVDPWKQRLFLQTPYERCQIAYDPVTSSIAVGRSVPGADAELFFVKRLEDLPFEVGPELHLSVLSQGKQIDLYASLN